MPENIDEVLAKTAVESGLITRTQLAEAMAERSAHPNRPLSDILVTQGYATLDQVTRLLDPHEKTRKAGPLPGSIAAKYQIGRELGRGGMGIVYEAVDRRLDRRVALKMIRTPAGSPGAEEDIERFLRECKLSANLSKHPHIVGVYEADLADGLPYLAMEFVDGVPMSHWLTRAEIPMREKIALLRDVALAVGHAHGEGIIHRDLKPANVLVDARGRPRVTDFGLAKRACSDGAASLTGSGVIVGTPAYMSPEQAQGLKEVDRRTDIYSLGVILYQILTGAIPFRGDSAMQILVKVIHDEVGPPSKVAGAVQDPLLETICLTALAKKPGERHPSAEAFAQALSGWLEKTEGRPPAPGRRRQAWIAGTLALAAAGILAMLLMPRPREISGTPPAGLLKQDAFAASLSGLAPEEQIARVMKRLQELNPGFDGKVERQEIKADRVIRLDFRTHDVTDVTPVRALPALASLGIGGSGDQRGGFADLSQLKGLALRKLDVHNTSVRDLGPIGNMPLEELAIGGTRVTDFTPIRTMKLKAFYASYAPLADLSVLAGMPLHVAHLDHTNISDLSPLKGAPLKSLNIHVTRVTDLSPLRTLPLEELQCDRPERHKELLKAIPTLKTINGMPASEVLK